MRVASFAHRIGGVQPATIAFAAAVLAFLLLVHWRWPHAPGPLIGILLATAVVAAFSLRSRGVSVVEAIPAGVPVLRCPTFTRVTCVTCAEKIGTEHLFPTLPTASWPTSARSSRIR